MRVPRPVPQLLGPEPPPELSPRRLPVVIVKATWRLGREPELGLQLRLELGLVLVLGPELELVLELEPGLQLVLVPRPKLGLGLVLGLQLKLVPGLGPEPEPALGLGLGLELRPTPGLEFRQLAAMPVAKPTARPVGWRLGPVPKLAPMLELKPGLEPEQPD